MKRAIDITVGLLLFVTGALFALACYGFLADSFFRVFTSWWTWFFAIIGSVAALAAVGLLRWRRCSACVGIVAEFILAVFCFPTSHFGEANYTISVLLFAVAGLVYWRFARADATAVIHARV
jgi:hypothetical protein